MKLDKISIIDGFNKIMVTLVSTIMILVFVANLYDLYINPQWHKFEDGIYQYIHSKLQLIAYISFHLIEIFLFACSSLLIWQDKFKKSIVLFILAIITLIVIPNIP